MFRFFLPFSLNNTLFLDTYKPSVIVFKCSLSFVVYKPMINIIVCKKKCWCIKNKDVNKSEINKKSNFVPLGERRNRF